MTRSAGAVGLLPFPLSYLATACWRDGDWAAGLAHAHAAVSLTEETGWLTELPHALIVLATFEATLGDAAGCREHAARAVELAAPSGARIFEAYAARAVGLLELGEGRPGPAAEHLSGIAEFAYAHGLGNPVLLSWAGDLVEAHVRAGQPHRAQRAFDVLVREAERTGRPTEHAVAAAAAACCMPTTSRATVLSPRLCSGTRGPGNRSSRPAASCASASSCAAAVARPRLGRCSVMR